MIDMKEAPKTYKQEQLGLIISLIVFICFIYQDIHILCTKQELTRILLCSFSLIGFLFLCVLNVMRIISNYRRRP